MSERKEQQEKLVKALNNLNQILIRGCDSLAFHIANQLIVEVVQSLNAEPSKSE